MMTPPAVNAIPMLQNAEAQIRLLRARRHVYAVGKRLLSLQIALMVVFPVIGAFAALAFPAMKALVALASLVITVLEVTLFDRLQKDILKLGAKLQEQFDCKVLDLPWDEFLVGRTVEPEKIHDAAQKHLGGRTDPQLQDWYPPIVGSVPIHLARIICQRTNLLYDSTLRKLYGGIALAVAVSLSILLIVAGTVRGLAMDDFILAVFAPMAPILVWGIREYMRQGAAADVLDRVRTHLENFWDRAKSGECSETECTLESRQLQNAIFERRSTAPLTYSWIYDRLRPGLENQMNRGAEALISEIK